MQTFYKFKHSDSEVVKSSSSGGAFTMLTDMILEMGGSVYGCILNNKNEAVHIRADNKYERNKMRGSKYIQSDLSHIYEMLALDLQEKHVVLFSGTPCQVKAIINYLQMKNVSMELFYSIEVICHGVGSAKFFRDYVLNMENKYCSKAIDVKFRCKYRRGQKQDMAIYFENGKAYHAASTNLDWYYSMYLKNLILRPSCYNCKFAKQKRVADLSIADLWGDEENDSFSLIVCNSNKGESLINKTSQKKLEIIDEEQVFQPHMKAPCEMPKQREEFWSVYLNKGYEEVQTLFGNNTFKKKIQYFICNLVQILGLGECAKKILKATKR